MYYEINVAKLDKTTGRYHHFFATSERSCVTHGEFKKVLSAIKARFLEPEYKISATYCEKVSKCIDITNGKEELK